MRAGESTPGTKMLIESLLHPSLNFLFEEDAGAGSSGLADESDSTPPLGDEGPGPGTANDETDSGFDPPFKLEDVPQEFRPHVEKYVTQTRNAYLQKTNELAAQRKEIESAGATSAEAVALVERLNDPEQVVDAMNELAERYDLVPDGADDGIEPEPQDALAKDVESIKSRLEREDTERQNQAMRDHVFQGIDAYKQELGVEKLDDSVVNQLIAGALAKPTLSDGMPDIESAIGDWKVASEAQAAAMNAAYLASKDADSPDLSGASGIENIDTKTDDGRREKMNAVAARSLASSSAHQ